MQLSSIIKAIFYSNVFYGICAVAMVYETNVFLNLEVKNAWFYLFVFCCTIAYYNRPYIKGASKGSSASDRLVWYNKHLPMLIVIQNLVLGIAVAFFCVLFFKHLYHLQNIPFRFYILVLLFLMVTFFYYGFSKKNLRSIGWLKPFIIAIAWCGVVTLIPIVVAFLQNKYFALAYTKMYYLLSYNFLFISLLCVFFDIKDKTKDKQLQVYTLPILFTFTLLFIYVLMPSIVILVLLGTQMQPTYVILPLLLPIIYYSLKKDKTLLYYLAVVDGILLLKAVSSLFF